MCCVCDSVLGGFEYVLPAAWVSPIRRIWKTFHHVLLTVYRKIHVPYLEEDSESGEQRSEVEWASGEQLHETNCEEKEASRL